MKVCQYCGKVTDDSKKECNACGSAEFSHQCENCGTVFDSAFCPNCGTKAGKKASVCPDCGTRYFSAACPNCGYSPARKAAFHRNAPAPWPTSPAPEKKKVSVGIILLWIFFWPIMTVITIWKSKMGMVWKVVLTLLILAFFAFSWVTKDETQTDAPYSPVQTASPAATHSNALSES